MADSNEMDHQIQAVTLSSVEPVFLPGGGTIKSTTVGCGTMIIQVVVTHPDGDTEELTLNRATWKPIGNGDVLLKFVSGNRIQIKSKNA